jgi:multicomponent Na+:H+ antiporter subunit C
MILALAIFIAALYALGLFMVLGRSTVKLVIGLTLLSHGANLILFTAGGIIAGRPPFVPLGQNEPTPPFTDPLPPALILTAIVIFFGFTAFAIVLTKRLYQVAGTDDTLSLPEEDA